MSRKLISEDRLYLILDYDDDVFETVTENIIHNKHDTVTIELIIKMRNKPLIGDEFFSLVYHRSYNNGIIDYGDYELVPMKKVMVVSYERK